MCVCVWGWNRRESDRERTEQGDAATRLGLHPRKLTVVWEVKFGKFKFCPKRTSGGLEAEGL